MENTKSLGNTIDLLINLFRSMENSKSLGNTIDVLIIV